MSLTYEAIQSRLEEIEDDLRERQPEFEEAAETMHKLARDYELRHARAFMAADGSTATERKAQAILAMAAADDGLFIELKEAEGKYEGLKAAIRTLETRATIGMSLLKQFANEGNSRSGPQPQWTPKAAA